MFKKNKLCIPPELRLTLIREARTSLVAGHFGVKKTSANLQRYVYWPGMIQEIERFVKGCVICCTSKPSNWKMGLYTPLPVPSRPWESISMDFLGGLNTTKTRNDYIFVIVDRFNKMALMIPCKKTVTAEGAASLFFQHVFVHFGLPRSIISDRDNRFLSSFWKNLWCMMDTKLKRSTAFHPQTDGQTEVVNRTIAHLLRAYNQQRPRSWDENLPYIQYCYNRAVHGSSGKSPFEVCYGFIPNSPFDIVLSGSAVGNNSRTEEVAAEKFIHRIQQIHEKVHENLEKSSS